MTEYVYDMSDCDRNQLTEQFLSTKRVGCGRFACFTLEGTDPFANIARQVERAVFQDSWGNDAATMKKEYAPTTRAASSSWWWTPRRMCLPA